MNKVKISLNRFPVCLRIFALLLFAFALAPSTFAQTSARPQHNGRYLIIFDTSADMKKRMETMQTVLTNIFATGLGGELEEGDSIGIWTLNQDLHAGEYPLNYWAPDNAVKISENINSIIHSFSYSKKAHFNALQPSLDQLVQSSAQLTVVIFCDGEDAITNTPYDVGINQVFAEHKAEQKKAKLPFIVVIRSQLGKYVACSVNLPPAPLTFPKFPPIPENKPQANNASVEKVPPPKPPVILPPMILIGTKPEPPKKTNDVVQTTNTVSVVETNTEVKLTPPETAVAPTNPPPVRETNAPIAATITPPEPPKATTPVEPAETPTPAVVIETDSPALNKSAMLAIGATLLLIAGGLTVFALKRNHGGHRASLITDSLQKK